ncbi:MAG: response regulator transcription factor [Acidobacteria bacterium]|nr:response regulator transcription factor [Acidobacteriota bacterium]
MPDIRLVLADDHTLFREGLARLLDDVPGYTVVGEAGDGIDAVERVTTLAPDVLVLDIVMPRMNGIDAARELTQQKAATHIVMLSAHAEETYVTRALKAGASAYVTKSSGVVELLQALDAVTQGRTFVSPAVSATLVDGLVRRGGQPAPDTRLDVLTPRERAVLQLVAEGFSNKDAAGVLSISPATVETHRARLMQKLDVRNTAGLVLFAVRNGLVT